MSSISSKEALIEQLSAVQTNIATWEKKLKADPQNANKGKKLQGYVDEKLAIELSLEQLSKLEASSDHSVFSSLELESTVDEAPAAVDEAAAAAAKEAAAKEAAAKEAAAKEAAAKEAADKEAADKEAAAVAKEAAAAKEAAEAAEAAKATKLAEGSEFQRDISKFSDSIDILKQLMQDEAKLENAIAAAGAAIEVLDTQIAVANSVELEVAFEVSKLIAQASPSEATVKAEGQAKLALDTQKAQAAELAAQKAPALKAIGDQLADLNNLVGSIMQSRVDLVALEQEIVAKVQAIVPAIESLESATNDIMVAEKESEKLSAIREGAEDAFNTNTEALKLLKSQTHTLRSKLYEVRQAELATKLNTLPSIVKSSIDLDSMDSAAAINAIKVSLLNPILDLINGLEAEDKEIADHSVKAKAAAEAEAADADVLMQDADTKIAALKIDALEVALKFSQESMNNSLGYFSNKLATEYENTAEALAFLGKIKSQSTIIQNALLAELALNPAEYDFVGHAEHELGALNDAQEALTKLAGELYDAHSADHA